LFNPRKLTRQGEIFDTEREMLRTTYQRPSRRAVLLTPFVLLFRKRKLAYEPPTLTRLPFTLPKPTGPFVPRREWP
jgi:hypothetical protein